MFQIICLLGLLALISLSSCATIVYRHGNLVVPVKLIREPQRDLSKQVKRVKQPNYMRSSSDTLTPSLEVQSPALSRKPEPTPGTGSSASE